jgi:gamma-glutamylcyclotransferase (GGCT)/AIG2-like uncharacterized protein YtfP
LTDFVFFYGTLMSGFRRPGGVRLDRNLALVGRGTVEAKLFDLGEYPAAIRTAGGKVRGEVYRMLDVRSVLRVIDEFEGCRVGSPRNSLYAREEVPVTLDSGESLLAWAYFYNAPLGRARRIASGDYAGYVRKGRAGIASSADGRR